VFDSFKNIHDCNFYFCEDKIIIRLIFKTFNSFQHFMHQKRGDNTPPLS
jgi:hypothetical protein